MRGPWFEQWRLAWGEPGFRVRVLTTLVMLTAASMVFSEFVLFVESRSGVVMRDPFLELLPVFDLTWIIFGLIYVAVPIGLISMMRQPHRLMLTLQVWTGMLLLRIVAMYVTPLDPPASIIPLADPFAQLIFGAESAPTRDLFFSGHTSTLFILVLLGVDRRQRMLFFCVTIVVAVAVLVQRVHYTVDVLAAPFFVYAIYRALRPLSRVPS